MEAIWSLLVTAATTVIKSIVSKVVITEIGVVVFEAAVNVVAVVIGLVVAAIILAVLGEVFGVDALTEASNVLIKVAFLLVVVAAIMLQSWWFLACASALMLLIFITVDAAFGTKTADGFKAAVNSTVDAVIDIVDGALDIVWDGVKRLASNLLPLVAVVAGVLLLTKSNNQTRKEKVSYGT